jgi:CO/xanthine dehydrogenase FAD-binding subunit
MRCEVVWEEYLSPSSIEEALEILKLYNGSARVIAGGTDLVLDLKEGSRKVTCLVDITKIEGLQNAEQDGKEVRIGATVTHSQVASSALIRKHGACLAEAAAAVGSPQIRNQGTIIGNVVNAQPAADTAVALFALSAKAEIATTQGIKLVPIEQLYAGLGTSKVDSTAEIVICVRFPGLGDNQGSAFSRLSQRKALALPMLNAAVAVTVKDNKFEEAQVVVAPVSHLPFHSRKAEEVLRGATVSEETMIAAAEAAASEANPRDSALRGSAAYRKKMVTVLVRRALEQATERAKQK